MDRDTEREPRAQRSSQDDDLGGGGTKSAFFNEIDTPDRSSDRLADLTLVSLQATFQRFGHQPSEAMWVGLRAAAETLEDMANGTCLPAVYVSSLDPGVGKTQLLIHFLRELLRSEDHQNVAAMVCVNRKDQIKLIAEEAALDQFAVLTADDEMNGIATAPVDDARVLFTTQQMVEARCEQTGSFAAVTAFHYRGRPRAVRIWDESMLPGKPVTVSLDELRSLPLRIRKAQPEFTDALDDLIKQVELASDGTRVTTSDLQSRFEFPLHIAVRAVSENSSTTGLTGRPSVNVEIVRKLWYLLGRTVTVRKGWGTAILDYRETLPDDLKPVLVLDASARVRTTYALWDKHRGHLVRLPSAQKSYSGLTINVWNRSGGKHAFATDGLTIAEGVARTIQTRPTEEWLVVHHKATDEMDFEKLVRAKLSLHTGEVHFLTWGRHDATNKFAHVSNVILAGTLFLPEFAYEALGRLAAARPSSSGPFEESSSVRLGELHHGVIQALCRAAVRGFTYGNCPRTQAYIIANRWTGLPQSLLNVFPGAHVADWQPVPKALKGQPEQAFDFITARVDEDPAGLVKFREVSDHLGIDPKNFKKIRRRADFVEALRRLTIEELEDEYGTPRGFKNMFHHYFGDDLDD
ncbi:hypothetical protein [Bradyrhizobium zhanjiangense]|uniref:Helicase/UvrB N-terminal domain-containing protein n=1 Tax=Bradyrhizobium zhanjiangense TaxID=1325107 RepID=A0A4Q0SBA0_9BRAD|nr:hypothetical protein [Bradyrhizobium zhanjiangense]RXH35557.1 hypothetical protein XH94_25665 [Bradyrhizobium zhanjiangense]